MKTLDTLAVIALSNGRVAFIAERLQKVCVADKGSITHDYSCLRSRTSNMHAPFGLVLLLAHWAGAIQLSLTM